MHKIYALFDFELNQKKDCSIDMFVKLALKKGASIIQYRDKVNSIDTQIQNIKYLKNISNVEIIVNDRLELVKYCDGLHLGQEDLLNISLDKKEAINIIRNQLKDKIFGLSTHNKHEIIEANQFDLDYIGLGAYRKTTTKDVSNILGDKLVKLASYSKHKVAAIGGIRLSDRLENVHFLVLGTNIYED